MCAGVGSPRAVTRWFEPRREDLEEYGRRRLIQLAQWREVLVYGSDEERQKLVASLREIDYEPLASTLDEPEEEVQTAPPSSARYSP